MSLSLAPATGSASGRRRARPERMTGPKSRVAGAFLSTAAACTIRVPVHHRGQRSTFPGPSDDAGGVFVTEVACDEEIIEFALVRLTGTGVAICESLWSSLPRNAKYRARLYVAMGMIRQTIAYPSRSQMPPLLGNYVRTSAPLRRHSAAGSNTEMRQRNSFLLPLGPKTHAHHGVNCALWGMLPGIFK